MTNKPGENASDEAWRRYVEASLVQLHTAAALAEIPDIADIEEQMR